MDELKVMVEAISKNKVKQIDVIGNNDTSNTQAQQLYDGIASGEIQSDEDIIAKFFSENAENAHYYASRVKRKLKDKLINTLFFVDINRPSFNEYNRAYFTCYRQAAAVKILLGLWARPAAIPLAEKTLKQALKFEFTELVYSLAKDLRRHYGTVAGDRKKFEEMNTLVNTYSEILDAETKVEEYHTDLIVNYIKSISTKADIREKAIAYTEELEALAKRISSPRFDYLARLVIALRYEIENDYKNLLKICRQAIQYFEDKKDNTTITNIFSFAIRALVCNIYLQDYSTAKESIEKCEMYSREGTANRFLTREYTITLHFHAEEFQQAYEVYKQASAHPNFSKLPAPTRERWRVLEAFIFYFIYTGKIKPDADNPVKKFRLSKFLNEVPEYSKDKRGINITLLILQILFFLHQEKYNEIIDRVESLKTYTYRYLRRDDTFRSSCFIRMLVTVPDASFHKKAVFRKAEKYRKKLEEVPLHKAYQSAELEIVPYETLWEMVLAELDHDWH